MKALWITIKRGLIRDPKHRQAMGECVWLFEYMLDIADWDTGIVHDWKDEAAAEDMAMPIRTLREQRRKLEDLNYVTASKKQYTQDIAINNWTNPRDYTGQILNKKQGGSGMEPQSDTQSDTQSSSQDVTPTFNPKDQIPQKSALTEKELEQANAKVTAMIENSQKAKYLNRDKIPPEYLEFCDAYVEATGQEPRKSVIQDWLMTFSEWQSAGVNPLHVQAAFDRSKQGSGWLVTRPGSLTNTIIALKGLKIAEKVAHRPEHVIFHHEEQPPEPTYVKMPDEVRAKLRGLEKKMEIKER
jgi:hypothetical protein